MWGLFTLALWLTSLVVNGMTHSQAIKIEGVLPAVLAALAIGLLNALVRPLLFFFRLVTFPLNLLTLGLFALVTGFVLNALLLLLVGGGWIPSFRVSGFWDALLGAVVLGLINGVLTTAAGVKRRH